MKTTAVAILSILALAADASAAAVRKSGGAFTTRNGRTVDTPAPAPAPTAAQARRDVALALANPGSGHSSANDRGARRSIGAGLRRSGGSEETLPPNFTKPGALIRTANPFGYSDPKDARTHTIEGGGMIAINHAKAVDVGRAPGIRQGAKDTLPPPNPGTGSTASGNNSITANSTTINNGAHDNQNGSSGGNGNGNGNGFGGGTGFDPSF